MPSVFDAMFVTCPVTALGEPLAPPGLSQPPVQPASSQRPARRIDDIDEMLLTEQCAQTKALQHISGNVQQMNREMRRNNGQVKELVSAMNGLARAVNRLCRHQQQTNDCLRTIAAGMVSGLQRTSDVLSTPAASTCAASTSAPPKPVPSSMAQSAPFTPVTHEPLPAKSMPTRVLRKRKRPN